MVKCYILMANEGEYEDRVSWPVLTFLDRDKAIDTLKKCESIAMRYNARNKRRDASYLKEYEALGICCDCKEHLITLNTSWTLQEAHFDSGKFK
jgi:hypothetical protein